MPPKKKVVIYSADAIRGSLIQKALEKVFFSAPARTQPGSPQPGIPQPGGPQPGIPQPGIPQHEETPVILLLKDFFNAVETLAREMPAIVVLDTKEYFPGELEKFRAGCTQLLADALTFKILAIGNQADENLAALNSVVNDWCMDAPLDPMLIAAKVKKILPGDGGEARIPDNKPSDNRPSETDALLDDLKGFLNIK